MTTTQTVLSITSHRELRQVFFLICSVALDSMFLAPLAFLPLDDLLELADAATKRKEEETNDWSELWTMIAQQLPIHLLSFLPTILLGLNALWLQAALEAGAGLQEMTKWLPACMLLTRSLTNYKGKGATYPFPASRCRVSLPTGSCYA